MFELSQFCKNSIDPDLNTKEEIEHDIDRNLLILKLFTSTQLIL